MKCADVAEPSLDAGRHHIVDYLAAGAPTGCGDPGHDLAVVGVDGGRDVDRLTVPAGYDEVVGRLAPVRGGCDDLALMRPDGAPGGAGLEGEHDTSR